MSESRPRVGGRPKRELTLTSDELTWRFEWTDGRLSSRSFANRLSGLRYPLSRVQELGLVFSGATDRVAEPLARVTEFAVKGVRLADVGKVTFELQASAPKLTVQMHVELDGATRRKWIEVTNRGRAELLLLDVELDDFLCGATTTGGGAGQPVFIEDEVFAAIEHPAGENTGERGRVRLAHFPGRRLRAGETWRSQVALVSGAAAGEANPHFLRYVETRSLKRPAFVSTYTPFGINNQWGAAPTLDDEQTLEVLDLVGTLREEEVAFDYFTLDTGWVDFASDLTQFRPGAYPNGPDKIVQRVRELKMKFGLWFAVGWGLQACWDHPGAFANGIPPVQRWREGYPLGADGVVFCLGEENYYTILKNAVLHHVRENGVRFLKFDGGGYQCDDPTHGHLPGKYATEAMYERLIDIANSARTIAPDVFVMWYWGLRSPFWALHGDAIFESGLFMEGSGTSPVPTLYYRDSVTLAQDQNAHHATTVPPRLKDSLGVWLSDTRWGNFMGLERWRESLVMDLGRGSRLFPNLWGNLSRLTEEDVQFLAWVEKFARDNAALFRTRRLVGGDPFHNDVYGYAYGDGERALVFVHNAHFASRPLRLRLDGSLGLDANDDDPVSVIAHFPERQRLARTDGERFRRGDVVELRLRPFETLLLEVTSARRAGTGWAERELSAAAAARLGQAVALREGEPAARLGAVFADAAAFEAKQLRRKSYGFSAMLPALEEEDGTPILAVVVQLRQGAAEWRYAPTVVQIVQVMMSVGGRKLIATPVPDGRQHGNTQSYGCSWVVYKVRLAPLSEGAPLELAVHAHLPEGVEARVQAWVVRRWWEEDHRPTPDGYYTFAPS
ncbi:hypothetical protein K0B96_14140 [Horticoccus luteus]|uniref:Alpha-galactosidase n=1 Tax=Horticoccus luteus TaxID=2862869 RepID=A0A8F9TUV7_9BACT|nr:hypothetical protein [Horticoccus luteus]QYM78426.1 hypothetical protein K0B96_14140 [Horticoccus luteus]